MEFPYLRDLYFGVSAGCRSAFNSEAAPLFMLFSYVVNDTAKRVPRSPLAAVNCTVPPICFVRD